MLTKLPQHIVSVYKACAGNESDDWLRKTSDIIARACFVGNAGNVDSALSSGL